MKIENKSNQIDRIHLVIIIKWIENQVSQSVYLPYEKMRLDVTSTDGKAPIWLRTAHRYPIDCAKWTNDLMYTVSDEFPIPGHIAILTSSAQIRKESKKKTSKKTYIMNNRNNLRRQIKQWSLQVERHTNIKRSLHFRVLYRFYVVHGVLGEYLMNQTVWLYVQECDDTLYYLDRILFNSCLSLS